MNRSIKLTAKVLAPGIAHFTRSPHFKHVHFFRLNEEAFYSLATQMDLLVDTPEKVNFIFLKFQVVSGQPCVNLKV